MGANGTVGFLFLVGRPEFGVTLGKRSYPARFGFHSERHPSGLHGAILGSYFEFAFLWAAVDARACTQIKHRVSVLPLFGAIDGFRNRLWGDYSWHGSCILSRD